MAGVDATMFFVLDVLRNIGGETWTESWTTGATARLVRSSCGARHTSSNVQLRRGRQNVMGCVSSKVPICFS